MKAKKFMYIEDHDGNLNIVMRVELCGKIITFYTLDTEEQHVKLSVGERLYFDTDKEAEDRMKDILENGS